MSVSFTDLYNAIIPDIGSFPKNVALRRLYQGAQVFCRRSESWLYDQTQNIVADQEQYTLDRPTAAPGALAKRLKGVWYGEKSADKQDSALVDTDKYFFTWPETLEFYDAYTSAGTNYLTTQLVLVPTLDEHKLSDEMMDMWGLRGFAKWATWDICRETGKPWSNDGRARAAMDEFLRAVAEGKAETYRERKYGDLRVVARSFV